MFSFSLFVAFTIVAACCRYTNASLISDEIDIFKSYGVNVIDSGTDTWTVEHHGLPDHGFEGGFGNNPNEPSVQNHSFIIPKNATVLKTKGCLRLGPIGMSISGAPFYNPYTGEGQNAVEGNCSETFDDSCSGHPSPNGAYHYHKLPVCMYNSSMSISERAQKFIGVALDGYPIYGPMDVNKKIWTSKELDNCHGHWYPNRANGRYMYRATYEFPYILGCFHGNSSLASRKPNIGPGGSGRMGDQTGPPPADGRMGNQTGPLAGGPPSGNGMPPGAGVGQRGNNSCFVVAAVDWQTQTCYAFCETPSDGSYDNCTPNTDTSDSSITKVSIICVFVSLVYHLIF